MNEPFTLFSIPLSQVVQLAMSASRLNQMTLKAHEILVGDAIVQIFLLFLMINFVNRITQNPQKAAPRRPSFERAVYEMEKDWTGA